MMSVVGLETTMSSLSTGTHAASSAADVRRMVELALLVDGKDDNTYSDCFGFGELKKK